MGKKKRPVEPDADGILRTGIYQRRVVPEDNSPEESKRRLKEWIDKLKNPPSIQAWLNDWLECCAEIIRPHAEIIRPHIDDNGHKFWALNQGDGWLPYRIADEIPDSVEAEQVRDAFDCMHQVRSMSDHISDDDSLTGDLGWLISAAVRLGRMSEKMKIRPFEPFVVGNMKCRTGGSKGAAKTNQGRAEMYAAEAKKYQGEVDALMAKKMSYQQATEQVAKSHTVSAKTVQRRTDNKSPRNRSRHRAK